MHSLRRWSAIAIVSLAALQPAAAQQSAGQARAATSAAARRALSGGQTALAQRTIEPLIEKAPGDREVVDLAISIAVLVDDVPRAFAVYDRFVQTVGAESAALLKPIAARELQKVATGAVHDPRLRAEVLERLGRSGDPKAIAELRQGDGMSRQTLLADTALMRLGDQGAKQRIAAALSSPEVTDKVAVVEAIRRAGDPSQAPLLMPLLKHEDPYTRVAAIEGLAALGYKPAIPEIRALMSQPIIEVRTKAAMALTRLGDDGGRQYLDRMKQSPVAHVRLLAVQSDPSMTTAERRLIILPALTDPDPMVRVLAAELIAPDDPELARSILLALIRDPDSTPRREAGRVLETMTPPDVALYRSMMADREPWVRLYGAGAILRASMAKG